MDDKAVVFDNTDRRRPNVWLGTVVGLGAVTLFSIGIAKVPFATTTQMLTGASATVLGGACVGILTELFVNGTGRCASAGRSR